MEKTPRSNANIAATHSTPTRPSNTPNKFDLHTKNTLSTPSQFLGGYEPLAALCQASKMLCTKTRLPRDSMAALPKSHTPASASSDADLTPKTSNKRSALPKLMLSQTQLRAIYKQPTQGDTTHHEPPEDRNSKQARRPTHRNAEKLATTESLGRARTREFAGPVASKPNGLPRFPPL